MLLGLFDLALSLAVFAASFLGTWLVRRMAARHNWMAQPRQDRWHQKPTALLGGVGFYPVFLLGTLVVLVRYFGFPLLPSLAWVDLPSSLLLCLALVGGAMVMFFCGLLDDLQRFRPTTKLIFQFAAASSVIFAGGIFPLTGNRILDLLATYFWFVGIINAVNMLDNMDGLCAGVGAISGMAMLLMTKIHVVPEAQLGFQLELVFIAALAGFLIHNWPPASIFMGDCGSMFAGFVLATLAMPSALNGQMGIGKFHDMIRPVMALMIPVAVLAVPIFDTTLVTLTRLWRAQSPSEGGRDHSSHRLVGLGLSEKNAVLALYALAAVGGGMALLMAHAPRQAWPWLGLFVLIMIFIGIHLGHVRIQVVKEGPVSPLWLPLVSDLLFKKKAAMILLDSLLAFFCFYTAYLLRFEGVLEGRTVVAAMESLPLVVTCCLLVNYFTRIYERQWRLMTVADLPAYFGAALGGAALSLTMVTLATRFEPGHSRSVYIIFAVLFFLLMVGFRLSFHLMDSFLFKGAAVCQSAKIPLLIYGAGKAGKILFEEIMSNPKWSGYRVAGFIDDDKNLIHHKLFGLSIQSGEDWAAKPCPPFLEIWISSPLISEEKGRQVVSQWIQKIPLRRLKIEIV